MTAGSEVKVDLSAKNQTLDDIHSNILEKLQGIPAEFKSDKVATLAWAIQQRLQIFFNSGWNEEKLFAKAMVPIGALDGLVLTGLRNCNYYTDPNAASNHNAFNGYPAFDDLYLHNPVALEATAVASVGAVALYLSMDWIRASRAQRASAEGTLVITFNNDKEYVAKILTRLKKYYEKVSKLDVSKIDSSSPQYAKLEAELLAIDLDITNMTHDLLVNGLVWGSEAQLSSGSDSEHSSSERSSSENTPSNSANNESAKKKTIRRPDTWGESFGITPKIDPKAEECSVESVNLLQGNFNKMGKGQILELYEELKKSHPEQFSYTQKSQRLFYDLHFTVDGSKVDFAFKKQKNPVLLKSDNENNQPAQSVKKSDEPDKSYLQQKIESVKKWFNDRYHPDFSPKKAINTAVVAGWPMCYWILWMSLKIVGAYMGVPYAGFGVFAILGMAAILPAIYLGWKAVRYAIHLWKYKYKPTYKNYIDEQNQLTDAEKTDIKAAEKHFAQAYGIYRQHQRMLSTVHHAAFKIAQKIGIRSIFDENGKEKEDIQNKTDTEILLYNIFAKPDSEVAFEEWYGENQEVLVWLKLEAQKNNTHSGWEFNGDTDKLLVAYMYQHQAMLEYVKTSQAYKNRDINQIDLTEISFQEASSTLSNERKNNIAKIYLPNLIDQKRVQHYEDAQAFKSWLKDNEHFLNYLDKKNSISELNEEKQQDLLLWLFWQQKEVDKIKNGDQFKYWKTQADSTKFKKFDTWYKDIREPFSKNLNKYAKYSTKYLEGAAVNTIPDLPVSNSLDGLPEFAQRLLYKDSASKRNWMMAGSALYRGITMFMIMSFMLWPWLDAVQTLVPILAAGPIGAAILILSNVVSVYYAVKHFNASFRDSEKTYYASLEKLNAPETQILLREYALNEKAIAAKRAKIAEKEAKVADLLASYNELSKSDKEFKVKYSAYDINAPREDDGDSYGTARKPHTPSSKAWTYFKKGLVRLDSTINTMGSIMFIGRMTLDTTLSILALISIVVLVTAAPHAALIAFTLGMIAACIGGVGKAILGYHNSQQMQRDLDIINNIEGHLDTQRLELSDLDKHLDLLAFQENALQDQVDALGPKVKVAKSEQTQSFGFSLLSGLRNAMPCFGSAKEAPNALPRVPTERELLDLSGTSLDITTTPTNNY